MVGAQMVFTVVLSSLPVIVLRYWTMAGVSVRCRGGQWWSRGWRNASTFQITTIPSDKQKRALELISPTKM
jgi:hypothetical protein